MPFFICVRCCAGDQFALFESIVALAILLRRFEFRMAPGAPSVGMTTVSALLFLPCLIDFTHSGLGCSAA